MKKIYQTNTAPGQGNCFAACVASILELSLEQVPHFCLGGEDWWHDFQAWLAVRNLVAFEASLPVPLVPCLARVTSGALMIVSGRSPRSTPDRLVLHAVVARAKWAEGYEIIHDPHPAGGGFEGDPTHVTIIGSFYRE